MSLKIKVNLNQSHSVKHLSRCCLRYLIKVDLFYHL